MWPFLTQEDLQPISSKLQELEQQVAALQKTVATEIQNALVPFSTGPGSVQSRIVSEVRSVLAPLPPGFDTIPARLSNIDQQLFELQKTLQSISPTKPDGTQKSIRSIITQRVEKIVSEAYDLGTIHGQWLANHQDGLEKVKELNAQLASQIAGSIGEVNMQKEDEEGPQTGEIVKQ